MLTLNFSLRVYLVGTMLDTSYRTLKLLAALVWYIGGVVLLWKGVGQLERAMDVKAAFAWPALAVVAGMLVGSLKIRYIFVHACRKNLARIMALPRPRIWQFYRSGFFLFMFMMIMLGRYLSQSAEGHYVGLLAMAILEISLGIALLGSSYVFWQEPATETGNPAQH